MKKSFLFAIVFLLIISVALTACGQSGGKQPDKETIDQAPGKQGGNNTAQNEDDDSLVTPPGTFPIVKEKVTLKVMMRTRDQVEDFNTNKFTKWYEERTNVHIEFEEAADPAQALNLSLASGDYPDIYMSMNINNTHNMIYGSQQGIFLPLDDLIEKHGYYIKDVFEEYPLAKQLLTLPDGKIYGMPEVNICYHCFYAQRMWIYQPWLDKLGLEMPQTIEDFYQVLKAFKEQDPNGNGKADEIPYAHKGDGIDMSLMRPFIYNDKSRTYMEDGKIDVPFNKPEYKEGLLYVRKLYEEGLILPEIFTIQGNDVKQLTENPDAAIVGVGEGSHPGQFSQLQGESGRWLEFKPVPPLEGPSGLKQAFYSPFSGYGQKLTITKACKYPEVAFRWADGFYNEEVRDYAYLGEKGVDWVDAQPGEMGLDGKQGLYRWKLMYGELTNAWWYQNNPGVRSHAWRMGAVPEGKLEEDLEYILYNATKNAYEPYAPDVILSVPPLIYTEEQAAELAELSSAFKTYVEESIARFIIGDLDIEKDWDTYVSEIDNMGLERYLQLMREAFDSQWKGFSFNKENFTIE